MPRPKTKEELIFLSQSNYKKLMNYIDSLPKSELEKEFSEEYLNRNTRDVLAHLHHWHKMLLEWYQTGMIGEKPDIPARGYTWKTLPELNKHIRELYDNIDFVDAKKMLNESFNEVQELIKNHSDKNLFEKKRYNWTGSTSLAAYLISATSSHYDWALKLIKKCGKNM